MRLYMGKVKLDLPDKSKKGTGFISMSPPRIILLGFGSLILLGTILLLLPAASSSNQSAGILTALFTATSAVCVTGLVVVDTATAWSSFGQIVIIVLIQIGALGIMSMATLFSLVVGRKMGLKERLLIRESLNEFSLSGVVRMLRNILIATIAIETVGALLLSIRLIPLFGVKDGITKSIFHSVSAFCNAGFDIFGTVDNKFASLSSFTDEPAVLLTISALFITGGLGFIVWRDAVKAKRFSELMLHTRVVLLATAFLIVFGTILVFLLENNNSATLGNMPFFTKLLNSFFHSVTPRTAGFNTLPIDRMTDSSKFLTLILMFIGAAPGSTGGGVKLTTISIVIYTVIAYIRGREEINMMGRRIPDHLLKKSLSIVTLSLALVIATTLVLLINNEGSFMETLFEATSAFGTVGLSTGITPGLNTISRLAIIVTMFLGRVGPVSAAIALALSHNRGRTLYKFPEGKITVG
jgi:trk system potassium uptake protein